MESARNKVTCPGTFIVWNLISEEQRRHSFIERLDIAHRRQNVIPLFRTTLSLRHHTGGNLRPLIAPQEILRQSSDGLCALSVLREGHRRAVRT